MSTSYSAEDLAYFAHEYKGAPWMAHVAGPDTCLTRDGAVPFTEESARKAADAYNAFGKRERELSEFAPHIHATVFHHGVPAEAAPADAQAEGTDAITVTTVRKSLIAESYEHYEAIKRITADARLVGEMTETESNHLGALVRANSYSYLLAFILRFAAEKCGADEAQYLANVIDVVRDAGIEVLEDANDDLDEQARQSNVHVTFGPVKPGQGKSQAAAEMACGFELEDGSVAYYGVGGAE